MKTGDHSHKEGCVRGVASNHGDPEHLWNQLGTGYTMNGFRKAVQAAMKGGGVTTTPSTGNAATGGTGATVKPYLVRVTVSDLYIRKGPGTTTGRMVSLRPVFIPSWQKAPGPVLPSGAN
mgnify:FL=1